LGPGPHYYLVDFIGPIKPEWLDEIKAHGGEPKDPVPPYSYVVALDDPAYEWISHEPRYVGRVTHYDIDMRISPELYDAVANDPFQTRGPVRSAADADIKPPPTVEPIPATFSVRFFEPADLSQGLPTIAEMGGSVGEYRPDSTLITVSFPPDEPDLTGKLEQLARLHGVRSIEPYALRQLRNNVAIGLMDGKELANPSGLGLTGRGEIVGLADSGLDTGDPSTIHPDFTGRLSAVFSWPVTADYARVVTNVGGDDGPSDTRSGHGTHVTGSIAGSGKASLAVQSDAVRGLACEAQIVFQAVEQQLKWTDAYRRAYFQRYRRYPPDSGLAGLPSDLNILFQQAYDAGVRTHNNSWGGGDFGAYDDFSEAVDRFMWGHKDFLILIAAGNDGIDANHDGIVDDGSITPPATLARRLRHEPAARRQGFRQRRRSRSLQQPRTDEGRPHQA
jgi:subtilisin family serine protease